MPKVSMCTKIDGVRSEFMLVKYEYKAYSASSTYLRSMRDSFFSFETLVSLL